MHMMGNDKYNTITKLGVTLRRLSEDKIELVRRWRNDPAISRFMEYREYITPEMQKKWFERINNDFNYYFIIEMAGKEVGLINIRDIDYAAKTGEFGIFIWDESFQNGILSYKAAICINDFFFYGLGLEKEIIHVLNDNPRGQRYHKSLGYVLSAGQEGKYNQEYTMSLSQYRTARDKIIRERLRITDML